MDQDYMLTTYDNPYNPFDDFVAWFKWDMSMGYNTCGLLAKVAATSPVFSDEINDRLTVEAMDGICAFDPTTYRKVSKSDYAVSRELVTSVG